MEENDLIGDASVICFPNLISNPNYTVIYTLLL